MTGVSTGIYDAASADLPVMKYLCSNFFTDCQVAIEIPTGEQYGIVVSKSNAGLTSAINEALAALKDDGTIESPRSSGSAPQCSNPLQARSALLACISVTGQMP